MFLDYRCDCGHVERDVWVDSVVKVVECPMCGKDMKREYTPPNFGYIGPTGAAKGG